MKRNGPIWAGPADISPRASPCQDSPRTRYSACVGAPLTSGADGYLENWRRPPGGISASPPPSKMDRVSRLLHGLSSEQQSDTGLQRLVQLTHLYLLKKKKKKTNPSFDSYPSFLFFLLHRWIILHLQVCMNDVWTNDNSLRTQAPTHARNEQTTSCQLTTPTLGSPDKYMSTQSQLLTPLDLL